MQETTATYFFLFDKPGDAPNYRSGRRSCKRSQPSFVPTNHASSDLRYSASHWPSHKFLLLYQDQATDQLRNIFSVPGVSSDKAGCEQCMVLCEPIVQTFRRRWHYQ